jgi:hypothetical protein
MVQKVFVLAAPFQVPHAGLPDLRPDDPAQVTESFSDGQGIGILMLKSRGSHSPWFDVGVAGASGDG